MAGRKGEETSKGLGHSGSERTERQSQEMPGQTELMGGVRVGRTLLKYRVMKRTCSEGSFPKHSGDNHVF